MNINTKVFLLNLLCFAVLFVFFRFVLLLLADLPYVLMILMAAILASLITPKFLVKQGVLWMKLAWRKTATKC
tara:strand:- start:656 stop:874 length:219 start_codon:yes stop_codon:yes gene_type:complete